MSTFQDRDEAREYFKGDRYAAMSGIRIDELGEDSSVCSMEVLEEHKNANGGVMGGAIFTLADFAFAVASNNIHRPTVAQQVSINFLNGVKGKKLIAHAKCRKNGRTSSIFNIDITDDLGRDIAQFVATGFKL